MSLLKKGSTEIYMKPVTVEGAFPVCEIINTTKDKYSTGYRAHLSPGSKSLVFESVLIYSGMKSLINPCQSLYAFTFALLCTFQIGPWQKAFF